MCSARFDALFEKGRDAILAGAGEYQIPPVDGGRWGMTVVLRSDRVTARRIEDLTREAMAVAGPAHWPTGYADSSHFTVRALERHRVDVAEDDANAARYLEALRTAAATIGPISLALTGVTLTPNSVMLCADPIENKIQDFHARLGDALGADGWLEANIGRKIWYANLVHFTSAPDHPPALVDWVARRRALDMGLSHHYECKLIVYRFTGSRITIKTLATVPLG